jgi:hypothetical protein
MYHEKMHLEPPLPSPDSGGILWEFFSPIKIETNSRKIILKKKKLKE